MLSPQAAMLSPQRILETLCLGLNAARHNSDIARLGRHVLTSIGEGRGSGWRDHDTLGWRAERMYRSPANFAAARYLVMQAKPRDRIALICSEYFIKRQPGNFAGELKWLCEALECDYRDFNPVQPTKPIRNQKALAECLGWPYRQLLDRTKAGRAAVCSGSAG